MIKNVLKWAGGKAKQIDKIKSLLPKGNRLIEPFVGGGSVFMGTDYPSYLLGDINSDLISLYQILKKDKGQFIAYAKQYFQEDDNDKDMFYFYRESFNGLNNSQTKAALFLYLNRHGFNGLCRYNKKGIFNVPFGRYKKPYFPEKEMILFYEKAKLAKFVNTDFIEILNFAKIGDVIYCDPPYVPLSKTAAFTAYSSGKFNLNQHIELARIAEYLANNGIPVLISNHFTKFTQNLYQNASKIKVFNVQRNISCKGETRGKVQEVLALFS